MSEFARRSLNDFKTIELSASAASTFKGGGTLKRVYFPFNVRELVELLVAFEEEGEKPTLLGGGSNVVVADGEIYTPVVYTKHIDKIRIENNLVFAGCGARINEISRRARAYDLGGLEMLAGVPLTLGGALKMNAGAYGRQIFDFVKTVFVFSTRACGCGCIAQVDARDVHAGYRKGVDDIVIGATLELEKTSKSDSLEKAREYLARRLEKQPRKPSVGSVFKNGEIPSGKLIEACGLKGARVGGAEISEKHANFVVNVGGATASDFLSLVRLAEDRVKEKFDIQLEREFVLIQ